MKDDEWVRDESDLPLPPMTQKEKMDCVVMWLNRIYPLITEGYMFERDILRDSIAKDVVPCYECPYRRKKCRKVGGTKTEIRWLNVWYIADIFKDALEPLVGEGTVINSEIMCKLMDNPPAEEDITELKTLWKRIPDLRRKRLEKESTCAQKKCK